MREILRDDSLYTNRKFSLCDCFITHISIEADAVVFHFCEGFSVIEGDAIHHTHSGQVRLSGLEADDLSCWIIKRKATRQGSKLYGKPISIEKLVQLLERKNLQIELFAEMYEAYRFHWRGAFCPASRRRLSTLVVLETTADLELEYIWD